MLVSSEENSIVYLVVVVVLRNRIKCRAFLNFGLRSSDISATIANLRKLPARKEIKVMNSTRNIKIYEASIENVSRNVGQSLLLASIVMSSARNSICDHDQLCGLDVTGIEDSPTGDQIYVYQEPQEQLEHLTLNSWHPPFRLNNLIRKLRMIPKAFEQYGQIIHPQLSEEIIKKVPKEVKGTKFCITHKPLVREVDSTKIRIVYNTSIKHKICNFRSFIK